MAAAASSDEGADRASSGEEADVRDAVEVLVEEFFERRRAGDASDVGEFARRVPGREAEFRGLVAALGILESAATAAQAAATRATVPEQLGRFRLLRKVGRGGMGVVYEAIDDELGRHVALKVLPGHATLDEREIARFRREAQSAARLNHPHIVPVYGVGEEAGTHWISMQFIAGSSLDQLARAARDDGTARMEAREVARHGLALADALACAHAEGVLHRDVKPSNVLLDRSGTVWITDFGLATAEGSVAITRTGETVGTPRYMAPEAFSGWADPRTDVWGVGVTLYELLSGHPPFDGTDRAQLLKQIVDHEPRPLRSVEPPLPRDLTTIVHRCLQKDPGARYSSARDLADDLRRFLEGAPIRARAPSLADRASLLIRRHRGGAIAAAVALVTLIVLLGGWAETLRRKNVRLATEMARAEENLGVASDAIQSVLDEAADVIFRAPALDPMRRRLLEAALAFELRLLAHQEQSPTKRFDVALAHVRVGAIDWSLQRFEESRCHYDAAVTALRASRRLPGGANVESTTMQLATALAGIACGARDRGDLATAEAALREALAMIEEFIAGAPRSTDQAFHLVDTTTLLVELLARQRRASEGAALMRATLPRVTAWLDRDDAALAPSRVLRDAWLQLADVQFQAGETGATVETFRGALAISQRLVSVADPDVRDLEIDACRRSWLGGLLHRIGRAPEALVLLANASADLEAIVRRWPMVPEFRRDLATALTRGAVAAGSSDPAAEVEATLKRAIELADEGLAQRPDDASFAFAALQARNVLTTRRDERDEPDAAYAIALDATRLVEAWDSSIATWPSAVVEQAAVAWYDRGVVERKQSRVDAACASFANAAKLLDMQSNGGNEEPAARDLRLRMSVASADLEASRGAIEVALTTWGNVETAVRRLLESADLAADARAGDPTRADLAALLVEALNLDANVRARHGDPADRGGAEQRLAEALRLGSELVQGWPERADFAAALGMAHGDAGWLAKVAQDHPRARAEFALALPLLQRALEREPRQRSWRNALATALDWLTVSLQPFDDAHDRAAMATLLDRAAAAASAATADPEVQWEAARLFARAAFVAHGPLERLLGGDARDPWADAAMKHLRIASSAGFGDPGRFEGDVAFASLERRDDFRDWLADLTATRR